MVVYWFIAIFKLSPVLLIPELGILTCSELNLMLEVSCIHENMLLHFHPPYKTIQSQPEAKQPDFLCTLTRASASYCQGFCFSLFRVFKIWVMKKN